MRILPLSLLLLLSLAAVGAEKMSRSKVLEGFIQSEYESEFLTPLWQVIYHEGIRANHIIFSDIEMLAIENDLMSGKMGEMSEESIEKIEEAASQVFLSPDLGAIRKVVITLNFDQKKYLYLLYRRALTTWSTYIRNNLN